MSASASFMRKIGDDVLAGHLPERDDALALARIVDLAPLLSVAAEIRDAAFGDRVTYSRKAFLPLTQLCRDVCHYCTFAKAPRNVQRAYMSADEVVATMHRAKTLGCKEALFTLGDKPELRYAAARDALRELGFGTTIEYLAHVAGRVLKETGTLPHINAGTLSDDDIALLRPVSASMGLMLESSSERLCAKGGPHYGSPDKHPGERLATIARAGALRVPFTTGLLVGIGETREERIESLLALRALHEEYGHIQEIIVQNFRAKPGTRMHAHPDASLDEMMWTIAVARLIFGAEASIQAPPNLNDGSLERLVAAGIDDWGGVSPLTPDYVNPEAPWPHLARLADETATAGKHLAQRLTVYPRYAHDADRWLDTSVRPHVLRLMDAEGLAREDDWLAGTSTAIPAKVAARRGRVSADLERILSDARSGRTLTEDDIVRLFAARGVEVDDVCSAADVLRRETCGDTVSYVVNRNINYTNVCSYRCRFCAFSKSRAQNALRGPAYDLSLGEIERRVKEAWMRGATEVCMQGGIHPDYDGDTYLDLVRVVKDVCPEMHVHAFSPLEVTHGARTLGLPIGTYLERLRDAGLGTLPGTAAEILDDEVRAIICPDKLDTEQWLDVMATAHRVGLRTTATIMFGHVDSPRHWARHLLRLHTLQARTGGFTELVPLPFVAQEAPMYRAGASRAGPTYREAVLMHAVARLALHPLITNVQTSWVKMGEAGASACLQAGANDLGGTLMNESITRAAGAVHGQEMSVARIESIIDALGRRPRQRTTLYDGVPPERESAARSASPLLPSIETPATRIAQQRRRSEPKQRLENRG
jgi:FO synthase